MFVRDLPDYVGPAMPASAVMFAVLLLVFAPAGSFAGELEPPKPPEPTMKTIAEVEPRRPIHQSDLPLTISNAGSYYLAGPLNCGVTPEICIWIDASHVELDLRGFTIIGGDRPVIYGPAAVSDIAIRNGAVSGGLDGIHLLNSERVRVTDLIVRDTQQSGVQLGDHATVERCITSGNGSTGIRVGEFSQVIDCAATDNGGYGLSTRGSSHVRNSIASDNGSGGIYAAHEGTGSIIESCTVQRNSGHGILVRQRSYVVGNVVYGNAPGAVSGFGIRVIGTDNRIEGNHAIGNDYGIIVTVAGNLIVRNSASGNGTNYDIVAGNEVGPIESVTTATSPWANVEF